MTPIVCLDCTCEDEQAAEVAALIAAGLPILVACRATWGAA